MAFYYLREQGKKPHVITDDLLHQSRKFQLANDIPNEEKYGSKLLPINTLYDIHTGAEIRLNKQRNARIHVSDRSLDAIFGFRNSLPAHEQDRVNKPETYARNHIHVHRRPIRQKTLMPEQIILTKGVY